MENFDANEAVKLVNEVGKDELQAILVDIKMNAEKGETVLHIYRHLRKQTTDELTKRGFDIVHQPSIAIQKDGLYYSIYWRVG